jgi:hypothetical protein
MPGLTFWEGQKASVRDLAVLYQHKSEHDKQAGLLGITHASDQESAKSDHKQLQAPFLPPLSSLIRLFVCLMM